MESLYQQVPAHKKMCFFSSVVSNYAKISTLFSPADILMSHGRKSGSILTKCPVSLPDEPAQTTAGLSSVNT